MIRTLPLSLLLVVCGCASHYNARYPDALVAKRQYSVDDGYCVAASNHAVAMPVIPNAPTAPQAYTVSTTGTTYNQSTWAYGTYNSQSTVSPQAASPAAAFASGFASGENIGSTLRANMDRKKVYKSCMAILGWSG